MSGTSIDACDVVEVKIDANNFEIIRGASYPFEKDLRNTVLKVAGNTACSIEVIANLEHNLTCFFGACINTFLEQSSNRNNITAIGIHGQTVWHAPPITVQLVDGNLLSVITKQTIVADFRRMDLAYGGQGAPLVPAFHKFVFSHIPNAAVLNMGGISNITVLGEKIIGYDTGPANILIDEMTRRLFDVPYDKNSEIAKKGSIDETLLRRLLDDPYFGMPYPKSTGREYFNYQWLETYGINQVKHEDIICTLTKLSAVSIALEIKKFSNNNKTLIMHGGGVNNPLLVEFLQAELPHTKLVSSSDVGIESDYLEAVAFAYFAYMRLNKKPANIPSVTGASTECLLGVIYDGG